MTLAQRIRVSLHHSQKSQSDLARAIGRSTAAVSQWMTGSVKSLKADTADAIAQATGVRSHWLITGDGPMVDLDKSNVVAGQIGVRRIPVLDYSADPSTTKPDWLMTDLDVSDQAYALVVKGDSMTPDFKPGDKVIIDPAVKPLPGDYVVARTQADEIFFRKYRPRGAAIYELTPLNDDYPTMTSADAQVVGVMVEHRKYRTR